MVVRNGAQYEHLLPRKLTLAVNTILACSLNGVLVVRRLMRILRRVEFRRVHVGCVFEEIEVARQRENARNSEDLLGA